MAKNMYGQPNQNYVALGNVILSADSNGLIANVPDAHVTELIAQRCMDEDSWLKVQAAHPPTNLYTTSVYTSNTATLPMAATNGLLYVINQAIPAPLASTTGTSRA